MKKSFYSLLAICLFLTTAACGTTSSSGSGGATSGSQALTDRDIESAEDDYCADYEADTSDEQAAFGCFLSRFLLLPESADAQALLAAFGESEVSIETVFTDVLDDYIEETGGDGFDDFSYTSYEILPFNDILTLNVGTPGKLARIVNGLVESGTTHDELKTLVLALEDDFEDLETMLDDVLAGSTAFAFTVPQELFNTDSDLTASYNDVRLLAASIKLSLVNLAIFDAYDFGVEPDDIVSSDGTSFDEDALVADLNGAAGTVQGHSIDSTVFLTLLDETPITANADRCAEALQLAEDGLQNLVDSDTSDFLAESVVNADLETALDVVSDLNQGMSENELVELSIVTQHEVSLNLAAFFADPPSSTDVTDTDPFVNDDEDGVTLVEAFFQEFLNGIAEF